MPSPSELRWGILGSGKICNGNDVYLCAICIVFAPCAGSISFYFWWGEEKEKKQLTIFHYIIDVLLNFIKKDFANALKAVGYPIAAVAASSADRAAIFAKSFGIPAS